MSGLLASFGEEGKRGIESAGIDNIDFVYEDDKCEPALAVSAYKKLTEIEKVKYIIGPGCGSPQEAIVPLVYNDNVIDILPSAATENLYRRSAEKIFNIQYSLEDESSFISKCSE